MHSEIAVTEPRTITLDLGPRSLTPSSDQPFPLSPADVQSIGAYVDDVNAVWASVPDFRVPPELRGMVDVCSRWDAETRPLIGDMAEALARYGSETAPTQYGALADVLPRLRADPTGAGQGLASILGALVEACQSGAGQGLAVVKAVGDFSETIGAAEDFIRAQIATHQGQPVEDWQGLLWKVVEKTHADPRAALAATQKIWGVWQSLYTDLLDVQKTTAGLLDTGVPFLVTVRTDLAIQQWRDVGDAASAFAAAVSG